MDDHEYVRRTLEVNAQGIEYLEREFRRLKVRFVPTQGNFFLVDVGDGVEIYNALLQARRDRPADAWVPIPSPRAH